MIKSLGGVVFPLVYEDGGSELSLETLNLMSYFEPAAMFLAIFIVPKFSRKPLFIIGFSLVAIINILIGFKDLKDNNLAVIILIILLTVVVSIF